MRALDGTVEFWSAGCTRLYGFAAEEALGHLSHDLLRTEFPEPLERIHELLLSAGRWHGELRHTRADGSLVIVESDWVLHRDSGGEIRAVIEANADITEQKVTQHQLERANQELSQFSHIVSHDLQAPVRMVRTYAELLARRYRSKLDHPADEMLGFILQGAESMDRLIRTLLEYAHSADGPVVKQPVPVDTLMAGVLMALQPLIDDTGAEVRCGPLPTVDADAVHLEQVLQNLVGNALEVPPAGYGSAGPRFGGDPSERMGVRDRGQRDWDRSALLRSDFRTAEAAARSGNPRHRHRAGGVQEDRRAAWGPHLGGIDARCGIRLPVLPAAVRRARG